MQFKGKELNPWHVILRRVIFLPFYILALAVGYTALIGAWGFDEANAFWKRNK